MFVVALATIFFVLFSHVVEVATHVMTILYMPEHIQPR